jgi:hypothetical protein
MPETVVSEALKRVVSGSLKRVVSGALKWSLFIGNAEWQPPFFLKNDDLYRLAS